MMLQAIKTIFGFRPPVNLKALLQNGAQIIDVRSQGEYQNGHIKGSVNFPLDILGISFSGIKKDKPFITCCASGMRSATAESILKSKGFTEIYDGGGWISLRKKIR